MSNRPQTGEQALCRPVPTGAFERYTARPVRSLDDYQKMVAIRAAVFMAEQACPDDEEFDGNDLCATHFLVFDGAQAVGTLRMRWFAGFAKLERAYVPVPACCRPAALLVFGFRICRNRDSPAGTSAGADAGKRSDGHDPS